MADIKYLSEFILSWEGGFSNHPNDKGGATNMGVTISTWKSQGYDKDGDGDIDVADLKIITKYDVIYVVMKPFYWDKCKADQIKDQSIANLIVDWMWNSGKNGITGVQRVLGVKVDGVVGPKTIKAINDAEPKKLFGKIWAARKKFLENICVSRPKNKVFLKGWLNRLNGIGYGKLICNGNKTITF